MTSSTQPRSGEDPMLVKLMNNGQITLPAELRRALQVSGGDYLEAEVIGGEGRLKPVAIVDRNAAWKRVMEIVNEPKWRGPGQEPSDDEVLDEAVEVIHQL